MWCLGRLQTDTDREGTFEGLAASFNAGDGTSAAELGSPLQRLAPRWFVVRNANFSSAPVLLTPATPCPASRPTTCPDVRKVGELAAQSAGRRAE